MANYEDMMAMGNDIYSSLMTDNAKLFHIIRTGTEEEIRSQILRNHQNAMRNIEEYALALEKQHIVGTKFYVQGIDITLAMREKIYKDEYHLGKDYAEDVVDAIELYEKECFEDYLRCQMGTPHQKHKNYSDYIALAKEVNKYIGVINSKEAYKENVIEFRNLVKELVNARKKCAPIASFTKRCVPEDKQYLLNQETLTYDGALELAEIVIDNCVALTYGDDTAWLNEIYRELFESSTPLRTEIQEKFVTNHLEQCGLDRHMYKTYMGGSVYVPNKKFLIALGIFCEPYTDLYDKTKHKLGIANNLEAFMNQNSQSIKSNFATVTEFDNLLDSQLLYLIEDGLSLDMLAYMLKNFAKAGKDIKKLATD